MSRFWAYAGEAAASLWLNRTRSVLTMLGMIIGSASIIAVFGISKGATSGIAATIGSFGEAPVFVFVDRTQDFPAAAEIQYRDVAPVREALGARAAEVLPFYQETMPIRYGSKTQFLSVSAEGDFHPDTVAMQAGRKVSTQDVQGAARTAFLTAGAAEKLFGAQAALGKDITIDGTHFIVGGVYPKLNGSFFNSLAGGDSAVIPYTTFYRIHRQAPDGLLIYPTDPQNAAAVESDAKKALQHIHGARALYNTQNGQSQIQIFESVLNVAGAGLSAIGGVALLVAGIGIMNIMLVSVTERTREIGLRKSIGASRADIALQFLMEALLLALAGGGTGMLLGLMVTIGGAELISKQLGAVIIPYVLIVAIALAFSILVGTLFGLYPAVRAAWMDPIEALRS
ncbi:MAG: ABC transporter permease [Candidatus Baltobacteraceae bacterium]